VAVSSTEAEYVALSKAGREACWLRSLFEELGLKQQHPTLIKGDNEGSIAMIKNPQFHKQSKIPNILTFNGIGFVRKWKMQRLKLEVAEMQNKLQMC
jgi:hypothetical protein